MLIDIRHPCYFSESAYWRKWRLVYESGDQFISTYLKKMGRRESAEEFRIRSSASYSPGFVKIAVNEIKNTLYLRSQDVTRIGGSPSYQAALSGLDGGVDGCGSSISYFICNRILQELLVLGRVGVYIDMPRLSGSTLLDNQSLTPYLYFYPIENILSWSHQERRLSSLLLRDENYVLDPDTSLPSGTTICYRHLYLKEGSVFVDLYDCESSLLESLDLHLPEIPFEMPCLDHSIIADAANYQIALLNIESSDINFILHANFPFYTEQYDPNAHSPYVKGNESDQEVTVGVTKGRRYTKDMDRPGFISPPSDPIKVSMEKASQIKRDIRDLVNLSLSDLKDPGSNSSGLSYLALILEHLENRIAQFWAMYEGTDSATVLYPRDYSILNIETRTKEIEKAVELADSLSSPTYKKEICKRIARLSLSSSVPLSTLYEIEREIDGSIVPFAPYKNVAQDILSGTVSLETASKARGYPEGDVLQANKEHAERLARIQAAQSPNPGARGITDLSTDPLSGRVEKAVANDNTNNPAPQDQTRGEGK